MPTATLRPTATRTSPSTGIIKKSRSGICHAPGTTYYSRTLIYTPYATMAECLASGGRLPGRQNKFHSGQRATIHPRRMLQIALFSVEGLDLIWGPLRTWRSQEPAWTRTILQTQINPKLVFAHPDLLRAHPETSLHYRGIATLSLKRVQAIATSVSRWEDGTMRQRPTAERCIRVARTYNAVISVVITGTDGWTLENGYRNVLATIGITEDGALRNLIGQEGEAAVKEGIIEWLKRNSASVPAQFDGSTTILGVNGDLRMVYSSEPDIKFESLNNQGVWEMVSTVEIKSGTDPAGALERLGAIQKSFDQTPARSRNFAVLGIVTPAMRERLDELNMTKDFLQFVKVIIMAVFVVALITTGGVSTASAQGELMAPTTVTCRQRLQPRRSHRFLVRCSGRTILPRRLGSIRRL